MNAILITATGEHNCNLGGKRCSKGGTIKVGERAIKDQVRRSRSSCGGTEASMETVYFHEECWPLRRGRKGE